MISKLPPPFKYLILMMALIVMDVSATNNNFKKDAYNNPDKRIDNSIDLIAPPQNQLAANPTIKNVKCRLGSNGSIILNPSGGIAPYSYLWSNGATTKNITSLVAGVYTVTITDVTNAQLVNSFTILQPAAALKLSSTKKTVKCYGENTGSLSYTSVGGWGNYSYLWNNGYTNSSNTALPAGTYTVTVTDELGCTKSLKNILTQNPQIVVNTAPIVAGTVMATVSGGVPPYSYSWNTIPVQTTTTATGLIGNVSYTINVKDNKNCKVVGNITLPTCEKPKALSQTNITTDGVQLKTKLINGAASYNFYYQPVGDTNWMLVNSTSPITTVTGLNPASDYNWRVQSVCQQSLSSFANGSAFTTLTLPCDFPINLQAYNITDNAAILSWDSDSNATGYAIRYKQQFSPIWTTLNNVTSPYLLQGLNFATIYEWQVMTDCIYSNQSNWSPSNLFMTNAPICNTPANLSSSNLTTVSADVTWDASQNTNSYNVRYRVIGNANWDSVATLTNAVTLSGLAYASDYEWQVASICASSNSGFSTLANFTTLIPPCDFPINLQAYNITDNAATLGWDAANNASNYTIRYKQQFNPIWTTINNVTSPYLLQGLNYTTIYEWQVMTNCIFSNQSNWSPSNLFITHDPICYSPTNLSSSNLTTVSADVSWDASQNTNSYNVRYRVIGNANWDSVAALTNAVTLSGLSYASDYEWQVASICASGNSGFATVANFTTLIPPCEYPTNLQAYNITDNAATLGWDAANNASNYTIRYTQQFNPIWTTINNVTSPYLLQGLNYTTIYEWQVMTNCIYNNQSNWSPSNMFMTYAPICYSPTNLSSSNLTTVSADITWDASQNANSYNVMYRVIGNANWDSIATLTNAVTLSGLAYASDYEWQVESVCASSNSGFSTLANFTTLTPVCDVPLNLATTDITTVSAMVGWSAVTGASSYDVQYRVVGNSVWNSTQNTVTTSMVLAGLMANNNYEWQVKTNCIYGNESSYSTPSLFSTPLPSCDIPTGLMTGTVTTTTASILWNTVANAISYNLRYRIIGAPTWTVTNLSGTSKTINGLSIATNYEAQVSTNCSLNGSAYSSSLLFTTSANSTVDSIAYAYSNWKYFDLGVSPGATWNNISFNDSNWANGNAELGYGDSDETTVVGYGGNSSNKYITTYFRKKIHVTNAALYQSLALNVVRDDGVVVYINGTEVYRNNMPTGTVTNTTLASTGIGSADEYTFQSANVSSAALVNGINVIAVEMHQNSASSTDLSFNLKLGGSTAASQAALTRGPYLQVITSSSVRVRWKTDLATDGTIQYGTSLSYGSVTSDNTLTTDHDVLISGLSSATTYYYKIGLTGQDLQGDANNFFKTAPSTGDNTPFRIWATGDFGTNNSGQTTTRDAMWTYTSANRPNLWIWLGDNAYNSGLETEYQNSVFNIYPNQMKSIPIYPCLGNHDYANAGYKSTASLGTSFPYFTLFTCPTAGEAGGVPSGTEKYYSYNYGNAHFIVLDSYGALNASGTPMYNWLQSDLAANTQKFTVAMWHHSPYTMGTHNSDTEAELIDMRNNINPLLEQYKVDLVLNGHSHVYERTWLIKGHFGLENSFTNSMKVDSTNGMSPYYLKSAAMNNDGTVYAVVGCSGQGGSGVSVKSSWPHAAMQQYAKAFGSMIIDFNSDTLNAKFLTSTNTIYDEFKIVKSGNARMISQVQQDVPGILAYPNPFGNELSIRYQLETASAFILEIYNALGELVYTNTRNSGQTNLPGVYEFTIESDQLKNNEGLLLVKITSDKKVVQTIVNHLKQ